MPAEPREPSWFRGRLVRLLAVVLAVFTLAEVNYPRLLPESQLAIFALLGLAICFLAKPVHPTARAAAWIDGLLVVLAALTCGYVALQNEPFFSSLWLGEQSLGNRAGAEHTFDYVVGAIGLLIILEGARRTVGWALPVLSLIFLAYARFGSVLPNALFPHRGYDLDRIVAQTFLHSQGVFGTALKVMFTYVFLFVIFGALLEATGASAFVIAGAKRVFGDSAGGPAKVAVTASGLMGSLSGSAVANTATTGTFTIPLMKSAGFRPHTAGGIEAAASSGGALVPPVMGAGAYMMLEIVQPPVSYVTILRAAILPALLYYLALFLIVHFAAGRASARREAEKLGEQADANAVDLPGEGPPPTRLAGVIFAASLAALLAVLFAGGTVFRAVSLAMLVAVALSWLSPTTRMTAARLVRAIERAARGGVALVAAAACVGIVLGVVTLTGVGTRLPATILPLAEQSLPLALLLIMVSSLVLGMGLPSAVCYLLLATLIGPAIGDLGVVPLAAHLFIFYFGLMSMVTPPVALAAYTAASIAGSGILRTAFAAFRFALIGFVLPFIFIYRPELLMLAPDGGTAAVPAIFLAFFAAALATVPLAAGIAGRFAGPMAPLSRGLLLLAAVGLLYPGRDGSLPIAWLNLAGLALFAVVATVQKASRRRAKAVA